MLQNMAIKGEIRLFGRNKKGECDNGGKDERASEGKWQLELKYCVVGISDYKDFHICRSWRK